MSAPNALNRRRFLGVVAGTASTAGRAARPGIGVRGTGDASGQRRLLIPRGKMGTIVHPA